MLLERDHYALINHVITALTSSVNFTRKYELSGSNNKFFILLNNFKITVLSISVVFSLPSDQALKRRDGNVLCGWGQYHILFMREILSWTLKEVTIFQVLMSIQSHNKNHLFPSLDVRCRNFQYTIVLLLSTNNRV